MEDYSYIFLSVMVLTNTGSTPGSHNLKQLKNTSGGSFTEEYITVKSIIQHFFYTSCLFRYVFSKICINRILPRISKVKTVKIEH